MKDYSIYDCVVVGLWFWEKHVELSYTNITTTTNMYICYISNIKE